VPYLPNVIAGFDPRPWEEQGPSFTDPTRAEWAAALTQARDLVADPANSIFGLPDASSPTGLRPAISIYAWNELGVSEQRAQKRRLHHASLVISRARAHSSLILPPSPPLASRRRGASSRRPRARAS